MTGQATIHPGQRLSLYVDRPSFENWLGADLLAAADGYAGGYANEYGDAFQGELRLDVPFAQFGYFVVPLRRRPGPAEPVSADEAQ